MKPSDDFRRNGFTTYQQDQYLEPIIPLVGEDNIIWGAARAKYRLFGLSITTTLQVPYPSKC